MSKVILYTTHCPKCKVLETKLKQLNIDYQIIEDEKIMMDKGFMEAPKLEVDGEVMNYITAINWLKKKESN